MIYKINLSSVQKVFSYNLKLSQTWIIFRSQNSTTELTEPFPAVVFRSGDQQFSVFHWLLQVDQGNTHENE